MAGQYQFGKQKELDELTDKILNREKFNYDLNSDAFYNQYKDKFTQQGKMAMMDTMGQAATLTGGYGSSYAQQVGQQAYQGYLQNLNDVVPELYQLALDNYNRQGDDLTRQYGLLAEQDALDYSRYRDTVADQQWQQQMAYQKERDAVADSQWQKQFNESKRQYNEQAARAAKAATVKDSDDDENSNPLSFSEAWKIYEATGDATALLPHVQNQMSYQGYINLQGGVQETQATRNIAQSIDGNIAVMRKTGKSEDAIRNYVLGTLDRDALAGGLSDREFAWLLNHYEIIDLEQKEDDEEE